MNDYKANANLNASTAGFSYCAIIFLYVIATVVVQTVAGALLGTASWAYTAVCSMVSGVCILAVTIFCSIRSGNGFRVSVRIEKSGGYHILLAFILAGGMFTGMGFVNTAIAEILQTVGLKTNAIAVPLDSLPQLIVFTFTFAILPAIAEEMFFRGLLLNCLAGFKSIVAVLVSALCFATYHCSLTQFVYQFVYGVMLGFLAISSKSSVPCMIAHFLNNFTVLILQYLKVNVNLFDSVLIVIGINLLAIFCAVLFFTVRKNKSRTERKDKISKFFIPFGSLAILLCAVIMVTNAVV